MQEYKREGEAPPEPMHAWFSGIGLGLIVEVKLGRSLALPVAK